MRFSILITTKNRLEDLKYTLHKIRDLVDRDDVEVLIYDDASTDNTYEYLKRNYPKIILFRNEKSKGLIHNRNVLLNSCRGDFAISLDDDLHFITEKPIEIIDDYFEQHHECGLIAFRIFWGKSEPDSKKSYQKNEQVRSFAGGAHVWRMDAWRKIPNYPEWFIFYGEEDFASYHLFKNNIEIHYVPELFTHHRVDVKGRKRNADYRLRLRRSLRSGWYLFVMFYPISKIPKIFLYSLWMQIKNKTLKGDFKATFGILQAIGDLIIHFPKLLDHSSRLTVDEYEAYLKLPPAKLYWKSEDEQ